MKSKIFVIAVTIMILFTACTGVTENTDSISKNPGSNYEVSFFGIERGVFSTYIIDPSRRLYILSSYPLGKKGERVDSEELYFLLNNVKSIMDKNVLTEDGLVYSIPYQNEPIKIAENVSTFGGFQNIAGFLFLKNDNSLWEYSGSETKKILDDVKMYNSNLALKNDGSLWKFGNFGYNIKLIKLFDDVKSFYSDKNNELVYVIKNDNSLWSSGNNTFGGLGNGSTKDSKVPVKILDSVDSFYLYNYSAYAIKQDHSLWSCDDVELRQTYYSNSVKKKIFPIKVMDGVKTMKFYNKSIYALKDDNSIWNLGYTFAGKRCESPVKIISDVKEMYVNNEPGEPLNEIFFIKNDQSLWCINKSDSITIPKKVLDKVREFKYSFMGNLAITEDGSLWVWMSSGWALFSKSHSPIKVSNDVAHIVTTSLLAFFTKNDGTLWAIGHIEDRLKTPEKRDYLPWKVDLK